MAGKTKKFKGSDELFIAAGLAPEEVLIANFRVPMCIEIAKRVRRLVMTQEMKTLRNPQASLLRLPVCYLHINSIYVNRWALPSIN